MGALGIAALGIFLTAGTAAMADPVKLICPTNNPSDLGPITIVIDESQSTVAINFPAGENRRASTTGTISAQFTFDTITVVQANNAKLVIDRTTGLFSESSADALGGTGILSGSDQFRCAQLRSAGRFLRLNS